MRATQVKNIKRFLKTSHVVIISWYFSLDVENSIDDNGCNVLELNMKNHLDITKWQ